MAKSKTPSSIVTPARPGRPFYHHFLLALALTCGLIGFSLGLGIFGYHFIAGFNWVDSVLNASMILSGMGPVGTLNSDAAKLFAAAYALYSGLVLIAATGILLSPVFHRVLVRFHLNSSCFIWAAFLLSGIVST